MYWIGSLVQPWNDLRPFYPQGQVSCSSASDAQMARSLDQIFWTTCAWPGFDLHVTFVSSAHGARCDGISTDGDSDLEKTQVNVSNTRTEKTKQCYIFFSYGSRLSRVVISWTCQWIALVMKHEAHEARRKIIQKIGLPVSRLANQVRKWLATPKNLI